MKNNRTGYFRFCQSVRNKRRSASGAGSTTFLCQSLSHPASLSCHKWSPYRCGSNIYRWCFSLASRGLWSATNRRNARSSPLSGQSRYLPYGTHNFIARYLTRTRYLCVFGFGKCSSYSHCIKSYLKWCSSRAARRWYGDSHMSNLSSKNSIGGHAVKSDESRRHSHCGFITFPVSSKASYRRPSA